VFAVSLALVRFFFANKAQVSVARLHRLKLVSVVCRHGVWRS
jgi:hypothetical protein